MSFVLITSLLSILVSCFSVYFLLVKRKKKYNKELFGFTLAFFLVITFHYISDSLQEMGITSLLDRYENYLGMLLPVILFLIVYTLLKEQTDKKLHRYKHILSSTEDHIAFIDLHYVYKTVNEAYCSVHKKSHAEIVGFTIAELFGENVFKDKIKDYLDQCFEGKTVNYQDWFSFPELGSRFMDVVYHPYSGNGNTVSGVVVSSRDITDLLNAQSELSQKTLLLETILQRTSETAIITTDVDTVITFINAKAEVLFGCKSTEVVGRSVVDIHKELGVAPERLERALEAVHSKGFIVYTHTLKVDSGDNLRHIESRLEGIIDSYGNLIGYSKFSWDVTERKRTESQLLESQGRYHALFDQMSDGVAVYKAIDDGNDFVITDFNRAAEEMEGVSREDVIGKRITVAFPGVEEFGLLVVFKRVWKNGKSEEHPVSLYKDGIVSFWRKNSVYKLPSGEVVAVYSDETAKKQSLEALQNSEEQYRLLVETMSYGVQEIDLEGNIVFANSAYHEMFGYSENELIGTSMYMNLDKAEKQNLIDCINSLVKNQPVPEPYFGFVPKKDGSIIYIETVWNYKRNEQDEVIGFISVLTDITERKKAETILQNEYLRFVTVMDSLDAIVYVTDIETYEILFVNKKLREMFGEVKGGICWKILQAEQSEPCSFCTNNKLLDSKGIPTEPVMWEFQNTQNSKWYQCRDQAIPWPDGRLVRIEIAFDITSRKLAEEALSTERGRLADIIKATNVGTWEWNIQTGQLNINERWAEILGYTLPELEPISIEKANSFVHPDELHESEKLLKSHFNGELEYYECEVRMKRRDSSWIWVLDRGKIVSWTEDGRPFMMFGTHLDITDRKRAEINLQESEEKARVLMNATNDYAMLLKPDGTILETNQAVLNILKLSQADVVGKCIFDFRAVKDGEKRRKLFEMVVKNKKPVTIEDTDHGRFYVTSAYPIVDDNNTVSLVALFLQDITERKNSEEAIQKRERYLSGLNEATQLLLASSEVIPFQRFLDQIGPIAGASRTYIFLNHTGSQGENLLSQKAEWCAEGILPEIDNPILQNLSYDEWLPRWMEILWNGELVFGRVADFPESERAVLEPQGILSILIIPIIVEEEFIGFIGYDNCTSDKEWDEVEKTFLRAAANDLSQAIRRVQAENKVLASLKEKEVLLREIHHRVKNNMQVVTSLLSLQARSIPPGKALDAIRESQRRISTISQVHEALYISDNLSRISMKKYLTGVLREITNLYSSLNKNVLSSLDADDINLTITDAIPLGLVTSELVTNAFKHAFPNGEDGLIDITLKEIDEKIIELTVTDDGIGMPEITEASMSKTLGLQIVYNLVKSQLKGSIKTIHNGKTIFVIEFARSNIQEPDSLDVLARRK